LSSLRTTGVIETIMRSINVEGLNYNDWDIRHSTGATRKKTSAAKRYSGKSINKGTHISTKKWLLIGATVTTVAIVGLFFQARKANTEMKKLNGAAAELRNELKGKDQNIEELKQNLQKQIEDINKRVEARNARLAAEKQKSVFPGIPVANAAEKPSTTVTASIVGTKADWMSQAGIPENLWGCVDALVSRESGWRVNATNRSSGAYGLPQSLPGSKMASAGADWQTNPVTQLRWMTGYVNARYGGFCQANAFQQANNWY
jgi:TolA-binding protein